MTVSDPAPATEHRWMLNTLMEVKATSEETGGAFSLIEQLVTPAGNPPVHVHRHEDESFLVLEGDVEVTIGDARIVARTGDFVFGPRGVPHTYAVLSEHARLLVLSTPGGVEHFFGPWANPRARSRSPNRRLRIRRWSSRSPRPSASKFFLPRPDGLCTDGGATVGSNCSPRRRGVRLRVAHRRCQPRRRPRGRLLRNPGGGRRGATWMRPGRRHAR